jgi:peptidoglycan/xylan/chitin deacetylase (PgdA/CDA1 family)
VRISALVLALTLGFGAPAAQAAHGRIALTFDDLPALTLLNSQAYVDYANDMILRELAHHHAHAIGFVNEGKLNELDRTRQIANLKKWLDADMELGNHTYSHETPNRIRSTTYVEDIARGEVVIRPMLAARHKALIWFRHPYLETGVPKADKERIDDWLAHHDYRIAPVTMENSDWMFAEPYDVAIARHETGHAQDIRAKYLDYTEKMVVWYQSASQALFGRQIPFVMLLHVTRLNADSLDEVLKILDRHDLRRESLEAAMKDPAYRTPDPYVGPDGIEWLERWSMALNKPLPWDDFTDPPADIQAEYKRVDDDH